MGAALCDHIPWWIATNLQDGFSNHGGGGGNCPIEGFRGRAATRMAMRVHFLHQNIRDTVIILEGDNLPQPTLQRSGSLEDSERASHQHQSVCQVGGTQETLAERRGHAGEH